MSCSQQLNANSLGASMATLGARKFTGLCLSRETAWGVFGTSFACESLTCKAQKPQLGKWRESGTRVLSPLGKGAVIVLWKGLQTDSWVIPFRSKGGTRSEDFGFEACKERFKAWLMQGPSWDGWVLILIQRAGEEVLAGLSNSSCNLLTSLLVHRELRIKIQLLKGEEDTCLAWC